ncbi:MAG: T9SS type A sorting domain-containing protein [Chitinophagales bacterium]|nr:T9SS type A sorting domain-containing protein [Chitinophagales bacterium]
MNEILLAYYQMEVPALDSDEIKILTPIAYSDPLNNGEAVYTARVLLGIDPEGNVKYQASDENFEEVDNQWVKVYPNPVSNLVNVVASNIDIPITLNVFSITGRLVLHSKLEQGLTTLDISSLRDGVYVFQATADCLWASYTKVIVTK